MAELKIEGMYKHGFGIIAKLVMQDRKLSFGAKALYSYLSSFCGNKSQCFPSMSKIVHDLKISRKTVYKNLKQLVENGYVKVEQSRESGKFKNNVYTILSHKNYDDSVGSVHNSLNYRTEAVESINGKNLIELENELTELEMAGKYIRAEKNIEIAELENQLIELEKNNKIAELKKKLKGVIQNG